MHTLGFDFNLLGSFLTDSGTYQDRDAWSWMTVRDKTTRLLRTPELRAQARKHFNCQTLFGVELEDYDQSSHFEKRNHMNDLMTATVSNNIVLSNFTLAFLRDTGWYRPNWALAEPITWAKDSGCGFHEQKCSASNFAHWCSDTTGMRFFILLGG